MAILYRHSTTCPEEALIMNAIEQQPIACCLKGDDYRNRIAWIEGLTRRALRQHARNDLVLSLSYAPEAASDVRGMVEQERLCCPFLTFEFVERADAVNVTIIAPESARESADMLFQPFLNGA
jgi:hypothetical protein